MTKSNQIGPGSLWLWLPGPGLDRLSRDLTLGARARCRPTRCTRPSAGAPACASAHARPRACPSTCAATGAPTCVREATTTRMAQTSSVRPVEPFQPQKMTNRSRTGLKTAQRTHRLRKRDSTSAASTRRPGFDQEPAGDRLDADRGPGQIFECSGEVGTSRQWLKGSWPVAARAIHEDWRRASCTRTAWSSIATRAWLSSRTRPSNRGRRAFKLNRGWGQSAIQEWRPTTGLVSTVLISRSHGLTMNHGLLVWPLVRSNPRYFWWPLTVRRTVGLTFDQPGSSWT